MKKLLLLFLPLMFFFSCEQEPECVSELDTDCFYIMIRDPVCGCDGVTYSNSSAAGCNNILDYTEGECLN
jgi:hypothetical protein